MNDDMYAFDKVTEVLFPLDQPVLVDNYTEAVHTVERGDAVLIYEREDDDGYDMDEVYVPYDVVPHIMRELGL